MQSIFRLPGLAWSQPPAVALDKPISFVPVTTGVTGNNKVKRKRSTESPRSSPQPVVKKIKAALPSQQVEGGAVQVFVPGTLPEQLVRTGTESKVGMSIPVTQPEARFATMGTSNTKPPAVSATYNAAMARHHSMVVSKSPLVPLAPSVKNVVPQHINTSIGSNVKNSAIPPAQVLARAQSTVAGGMAPPTPVTPSSSAVFPTATKSPSSNPVSAVAPKRQQSTSAANLTMDKDMLRAIIDAEICQAILFKHNELRLIDQEIAKCQVALEQIRRCEEIPFPGSQGPTQSVSTHSGPALATRRGLIPPASPAPWGVTDGPYTRHYASWLIPSSRFDAMTPQAQSLVASTPLFKDGRITRGLSTDMSPIPGSIPPSRASRVASRAKGHVDSPSPFAGRDPLIIKRQKDGQMVKLYCTQCQPERSDFANVQGFLNHCRISHKNDFKSHEQAAIECGRVVEAGDYFTPPEVATPRESVPKPTFIPPTPAVPAVDRPAVHALNKSMAVNNRQASLEQYVPRSYSQPVQKQSENALPTPVVSPSFSPASQTPFLSKLVQKAGAVSDFAGIVTDVKQKVDLSVYDVESETETQETRESKSKSKSSHGRKNKSASQRSNTERRASARDNENSPSKKQGIMITSPTDPDVMEIDQALSPHTSADSNPGLVSDREDDFADYDDDEPEVLRNPSQSEIVIVRIEDSDGERGVHSTTTNTGVCANNISGRN